MTRPPKILFLLVLPFLIVLLALTAGGLASAESAETAVSQSIDPPAKILYGIVTTESNDPVAGAIVTAYRVNRLGRVQTATAADGTYELALGPGLWSVTVDPGNTSDLYQWVYPEELQQIEFGHNNLPEKHELNFSVVLADAIVKGTVATPDGSPPPFTVTVGLHNGEGIGRRVIADPTTGAFRMALPHGRYDVVVHPHHDGYLGPQLDPVHLPPGQTVDLGILTLIPGDGFITGTVTYEDGNGVEGIPITAWLRDRFDAITTRTGPGGVYRLAVSRGVWHVQPSPGPDSRYLYVGGGRTVRVAPGETVTGVDFEVLTTDATIIGFLVTPSSSAVSDLDGWAAAVNTGNPAIHNGAPIRTGKFAIHIPGGDYLVSTFFPPGSPYLSTKDIPVSVRSGEMATITVTLRRKDAAIAGALIDPRQNRSPVIGVRGNVSAWSDHQWSLTHIRPRTGTYRLGVAAGVWHLNYAINDERYVKLGSAANIPVQSGRTIRWPLPITRRDAAITGQVLAPDGDPLPGAMVVADGLSGDVIGLWLRTQTDAHGRYRLDLPYGRYRVGATGGEIGWINPVDWIVNVPPETVVEHIDLKFLKPDGSLGGTLTVHNTLAEGDVLVWAWSERGGFTEGRFPVTQTTPAGQAVGRYELGVITGATWHLSAIFETDDEYWVGRGIANMTDPTATLDLDLTGPHPKPPPVVVTFDADDAQRLELADGTLIFIPAGAMPVNGEVTLRIVPLASLPYQQHAHIVRYGYAFYATDESGRPIEERFHRPVLIRFKYDGHDWTDLAHRIKPAYFSTTTNQWTFPEHYAVNQQRRIVTMAIDHFTNYALVKVPNRPAVFLPMIATGCSVTDTQAASAAPCMQSAFDAGPRPAASESP